MDNTIKTITESLEARFGVVPTEVTKTCEKMDWLGDGNATPERGMVQGWLTKYGTVGYNAHMLSANRVYEDRPHDSAIQYFFEVVWRGDFKYLVVYGVKGEPCLC